MHPHPTTKFCPACRRTLPVADFDRRLRRGYTARCRACREAYATRPRTPSSRRQFVRVCACGCGQPTLLARFSTAAKGMIVGHPLRYIAGHVGLKHTPEYVTDARGCWVWQWAKDANGYGKKRHDGHMRMAHRVYYELRHGPIPDDLPLDHLCRNPSCVNPDHLEPVTNAENLRRGTRTKLSHARVAEIKSLARTVSRRELAERYGVDKSTICRILNGKAWA